MPEPTLSDVMAKLESIERRVGELEKLSHPQHVMADPELTEAIRELRQSLKPPKPVNEFEIDYTPHLNTWTRPITLC